MKGDCYLRYLMVPYVISEGTCRGGQKIWGVSGCCLFIPGSIRAHQRSSSTIGKYYITGWMCKGKSILQPKIPRYPLFEGIEE